MKAKVKTRTELRCECPSRHLLGFYGLTTDGDIYLHVKSHRGGRQLSNVVIYGDCEVQCSRCERWHILNFRDDGSMEKSESLNPPAEIAEVETVERTNSA